MPRSQSIQCPPMAGRPLLAIAPTALALSAVTSAAVTPAAVALVAVALVAVALCPALASAASGPAADRELFARLDANGDGRVSADETPEEHRRLFDRLVRRADADRDGALTAEEFARGLTPSAPEKPIEQADSGQYRGASAAKLLLLKLDANRDTRLTRSEAPASLRGVFDSLVKAADRNEDGQLARSELSRGGPKVARLAGQHARRARWDVEAELAKLEAEQGAAADRFEQQYDPVRALSNPKQAADLFEQLDADGNGDLVAAELPDQIKDRVSRLLRRADADRSGGVSKREFLAAGKRLSQFMQFRMARSDQPASAKLNDRPVTRSESRGADRSKTSAESASDKPSASDGPAFKRARQMVARQDRDGNGEVTKQEARGRLARDFAQADADNNGRLDQAELDTVARRLAARLVEADRKSQQRAK
ncbi:MAG: hypothetical protein AAGB00_12815 [Planctomycetota bacterium]